MPGVGVESDAVRVGAVAVPGDADGAVVQCVDIRHDLLRALLRRLPALPELRARHQQKGLPLPSLPLPTSAPGGGGRPQNLRGPGLKLPNFGQNRKGPPLVKFLAFGFWGGPGPPNSVWLAATDCNPPR